MLTLAIILSNPDGYQFIPSCRKSGGADEQEGGGTSLNLTVLLDVVKNEEYGPNEIVFLFVG